MVTLDDCQKLDSCLRAAKTVFLCAHVSPDGDTLGSMLGLAAAIRAHYQNIEVMHTAVSGVIADMFNFMPGIQDIIDADKPGQLLSESYDVSICLDCGSLDRLGKAGDIFEKAKTSFNIDHHYSNKRYATINIIDDLAGASGEVVADILENIKVPLNKEAAIGLYVAILTDTGGFKYGSTSAKIFRLAAQFTDLGANPEEIYRYVYEEVPMARQMLHAVGLQNATFELSNQLAWTIITKKLIETLNAKDEYIEGLVESLRRIDTVQVAAVIRETADGGSKVSLRSDNHQINVAEILEQFGGGGHRMAAGCKFDTPPEETLKLLLPHLSQAVKTIDKITVQ